MADVFKRSMWMLTVIAAVFVLSGCTDWKKKYASLDVEFQNLQGRNELCMSSLDAASSDKEKLGSSLRDKQMTIEDLQRQIDQRNVTPGMATGFGDDMEVDIDTAAGTITVTLPNAILFSPGQATLLKATSSELNHVLSVLRGSRYSGKKIDIVGHTDTDPILKSKKFWKDNWELSAERALTVLRYMTGKGISADKIRAVAQGASQPVSSNSTSSGKARNRRVEVVVHMR